MPKKYNDGVCGGGTLDANALKHMLEKGTIYKQSIANNNDNHSNTEDIYKKVKTVFKSKIKSKEPHNYSLDYKLGSGTYGTVYLGKYNGQRVAIKQVAISSIELVDQLHTEMDIISQLDNSDYVATIIDYFLKKNKDKSTEIYIVYKVLNNTWIDSVRNGLDQASGEYFYNTFIYIAKNLLEGLAYIHSHDIVHGDIKPENILIDDTSGRLVYSDFGISCFRPSCPSRLTGSILYLDPMVMATYNDADHEFHSNLSSKPKIDFSSDIYSLGATLYYVLTGEHVYTWDSYFTLMVDYMTRYEQIYNGLEKWLETKGLDRDQIAIIYATVVDMIHPINKKRTAIEYLSMI